MEWTGRVVVLNGTASAGKSSIARAFRLLAPTMWIEIGQDTFAQNLVDRWIHIAENGDVRRTDGFTFVRRDDGLMSVELGPIGARLLQGYRQAVGALARAGNDVVVDETKFDAAGWTEWSSALDGLPVTWVRVNCDLAICDQRERTRDDRQLLHGLARGLYEQVHADVDYDLEVDTGRANTDECARAVLDFVRAL